MISIYHRIQETYRSIPPHIIYDFDCNSLAIVFENKVNSNEYTCMQKSNNSNKTKQNFNYKQTNKKIIPMHRK